MILNLNVIADFSDYFRTATLNILVANFNNFFKISYLAANLIN